MIRLSTSTMAAVLALTVPALSSAQGTTRAAPASAVPDSAHVVARLATLADSLERANALSGVILLARNGTPVFERAYGLANRETHRRNTVGTAFNLSSIGKRFTQIAVAQLVSSGKLNLDSTIASIWPDYPNPDVARRVTIRQLLEHRSGIGGDVFQHPERARSNSDYLPLFVHDSLRFPPGTREEYSNAGYIVLGEIVAHVSHEDYYSYVTHHLFEPAGMKTAGFYARDSLPGFVALGYTRGENADGKGDEHAPLAWSDMQHPRRGSAAGGSYASARDLLMLIRAYRSGRLGAPPRSGQSLIAGGSPGSNGVVAEALPGGYDLIVLENLDPPAADAVVAPVMSWLGVTPPPGARRLIAGGGARPVSATTATLPDTPAGHIAAEFLRAYNTGDTVAMAQFYETRAKRNPARPTAARLETYRAIFADNGRLTVLAVGEESATSLQLSARGEHGTTISLVFSVDQAAPYKLTSLQVEMSH